VYFAEFNCKDVSFIITFPYRVQKNFQTKMNVSKAYLELENKLLH